MIDGEAVRILVVEDDRTTADLVALYLRHAGFRVHVEHAGDAAPVLALLLAFPLVRQVERLGAATARVRRGDLAARVAISSRDELGRMERSFNEMAAELERANVHKRNLVHDAAHELRTPLTNLIGLIEAVQDGLRTPDASTMATLRAEAGLLAALVNDLQDLSLAESGQLQFDLTSVDVVAESAAALDAMRESAGEITLTSPARAPVYARADARRLRQVLRNLLHNAITHTPPGGTVSIEVHASTSDIAIVVRDTGIGIPAEHVDLIWERFHRVDASRDRAGGGRGLGLAIVKHFVERMEGRVTAQSQEGVGSTFEVRLPPAVGVTPSNESSEPAERHALRGGAEHEPQANRCAK